MSPACTNCYAETWAKRTGFEVWGPNALRRTFGEKHWREPLKWNAQAEREGRRHRVFCSSMADVFEDHPTIEQERVKLWPLIKATPMLDWQLLTKRADRIAECLPDDFSHVTYPNVWLGVTAENQEWFDKRVNALWRIKQQFPYTVAFISCEPLLGAIDARWALESVELQDRPIEDGGAIYSEPIDWIICGGESGHGARPMHPDWVRSLRDQCKAAGVSFFFKQWGEWYPYGSKRSGEPGRFALLSNFSDERHYEMDHYPRQFEMFGQCCFERVGKASAGRLLDGVEHNGMPEVKL